MEPYTQEELDRLWQEAKADPQQAMAHVIWDKDTIQYFTIPGAPMPYDDFSDGNANVDFKRVLVNQVWGSWERANLC